MLTTVSSEHSLTPSSTKEAAHLFATGKLNSLSIRTHAQESSGDLGNPSLLLMWGSKRTLRLLEDCLTVQHVMG